MSGSGSSQTLRETASDLLVWAFGISVAFHLLVFGGFELGQHFGWWQKAFMPAWLKKASQTMTQLQRQVPKQNLAQQSQEPPLLFVEVDPTVATPEPPKDAKYYSSQNAQAANPEADVETDTPKIEGQQTHVPKTESAEMTKPAPLEPTFPKEELQKLEDAEAKPKGGQKNGDLAKAKPVEKPAEGPTDGVAEETPPHPHMRPRTLADAYKLHPKVMPGEKMKEDGGVKHRLLASSLDTKQTPFGEYDAAVVRAIQYHWYDLLDKEHYSEDANGKVVVQFRLCSDGSIKDMKVGECAVGANFEELCRRAISDPAPYAPWPSEMLRLIGSDCRVVTFTFYYE